MHSSISSSDPAFLQASRWLRRLLIALLLLAAAIEAMTRIAFIQTSHIQQRIHAEYVAAKRIGPVTAAGIPTALLVGNSLLLLDADMDALRKQTSPTLAPARYVIENTQYLDWYFALRRLFHEGTRPGRIGLALSTNQLISRAVDGEYFGHYMMGGGSVIDVASDAGLDSTEASNLLFANWSAWFGSKSEIRKWFAAHFIPDTSQLAGALRGPAALHPPMRASRDVIIQRLAELKALSDANGVEIALILMPNPGASEDDVATVLEAGERAGLRVLVPSTMKKFPPSLYSDGFHLNANGAALFTRDLADSLRHWISAVPMKP